MKVMAPVLRPSDFRRIAMRATGGKVKAIFWHLGVRAALEDRGFTFTSGYGATVEPTPGDISLLVGSSANYELRLNGEPLGVGNGGGKDVRPDHGSFAVTLPKGNRIVVNQPQDAAWVIVAPPKYAPGIHSIGGSPHSCHCRSTRSALRY